MNLKILSLCLMCLAALATPLRFTERLISSDFTYPYGIGLCDRDGDGDLDVRRTRTQQSLLV